MNTALSFEPLESRCTPGGLLPPAYDPGLIACMAAAYGHGAGEDSAQRPAGFGRQAILLPDADLVLIGRDNDGQPSRFLDHAHDVLGAGPANDVNTVDAVIIAINTTYRQVGRPIDVILVGATTSGNSGVIVGNSYLFWNSPDTEKLLAQTGGQVASVTMLVSNGGQKIQLFQRLCDGWTRGDVVTVTGYTGHVFTGTSIFGSEHFYMGSHGHELTVHSQ